MDKMKDNKKIYGLGLLKFVSMILIVWMHIGENKECVNFYLYLQDF